jgi:hypothetical protein
MEKRKRRRTETIVPFTTSVKGPGCAWSMLLESQSGRLKNKYMSRWAIRTRERNDGAWGR